MCNDDAFMTQQQFTYSNDGNDGNCKPLNGGHKKLNINWIFIAISNEFLIKPI